VIWFVVGEAVALLVLGLFVLALVHSYAGLAARLEQRGGPGATGASEDSTLGRRARSTGGEDPRAIHVAGVTTSGDTVVLPVSGVGRDTLLAFLSSTCRSCEHLWRELRDEPEQVVPSGIRLIIVPKGPERESPSAIAALAPPECDVVMSSTAWSDFDVPGSPYFVLVDGESGSISGEGTAMSWSRVIDLMAVSTSDATIGGAGSRDSHKPQRDQRQEEEVDRLLMDAGVFPGDPSLYPAVGDAPDAT